MSTYRAYIERLAELSGEGRPFASVTLVSTTGSTPQDKGAKMLIDATGLLFGTVGGGRIEAQALRHAQHMLANDGSNTELIEWNLQRDVGMTCGGVVKLLFEVYNRSDWRSVIFGAGHVAQSLVRVLLPLEISIRCVDPRQEWMDRMPNDPKLTKQVSDWTDGIAKCAGDEFLICMTMGHRTDGPVLESLYRSGLRPPYLGVIGSQAKRKVLARELTEAGVSDEWLNELRCPIGLPMGTNQPGEIAISIAAEMIQVRDQQRQATSD